MLKDSLLFKGGTCIKKCYLGNYRFSEDLDFTALWEDVISTEQLLAIFQAIRNWVYKESGIQIIKESIRFEFYQNSAGDKALQGKLNFQGPLQQKTNFTRIKFDVTLKEFVVLPPSKRPILHPYSDPIAAQISCYCFEELFAEKTRALVERLRPRDLYDVVHLYKQTRFPVRSVFFHALVQKCTYRGISLPSLQELETHPQKKILGTEWSRMLQHQVQNLQPLENYWKQLTEIWEWIQRGIAVLSA